MIQPNIDKNGTGYHSDDCSEYDGKRCKNTGFCPGGICEPYYLQLIQEQQELSLENDNLWKIIERFMNAANTTPLSWDETTGEQIERAIKQVEKLTLGNEQNA